MEPSVCDSTERFRATAKKCEENRAAGVMLDDSIEIIKVIRGWGLNKGYQGLGLANGELAGS